MTNAIIFSFLCFILTSAGAGLVFILKKPNKLMVSFLNSFSAGVMISSSVFSLIIPSIEYCEKLNMTPWKVLPICFILAYFVFCFLSLVTKQQGDKINTKTMALSIALHNIPEGMCVGFAFASASVLNTSNALSSAIMIAIGIGIQNAPEGSSLSFPLYAKGYTKLKSFLISSLVGFIEVPAGIISYLLGLNYLGVLPFMLAFAAAIMIVVAYLDLLPEATICNKKLSTFGFFVGFVLMMILDLALG